VSAPDFSTSPRRGLAVRELALLAVALLLAAMAAAAAFSASRERNRTRARLLEVRRETDEAQGRLRALEARVGAPGGVLTQVVLARDAPPAEVLAEVAGQLPPDVRLEGIGLVYGRELAVELRVVARNAAAFDRLFEKLKAAQRLRDVVPGPESREGEVRTTVRAVWTAGR
jgi:ABC-type amino acid transport substrate-binding protein